MLTGFKSVLFSLYLSLMNKFSYTFNLALSLGSSIVSAVNMLLNGMEKGVTPYGVDAISYYAASSVVLVLIFTYNSFPNELMVSLNGDLEGTILGNVLGSMILRVMGLIPSLAVFAYFGAKLDFRFFPLLILTVILVLLLSLVFSYVEMIFPGSNFLVAAYNGLSTVLSGVWFSPTTAGPLVLLFRLTPQYWIGESVRLAVIGSSYEPFSLIGVVLLLFISFLFIIHPRLRGLALKRGYL